MAKQIASKNPGLVLVKTWVLLYFVNAATLYLANMFFPKMIVLGTHSLTTFWSIFLSMSALALIGTFAIPFVRGVENRRARMFSNLEWMTVYFFLNTISIWLIARYSQQFGLGIRTWYVAVILGFILDILQGIGMMSLQKQLEK